MNRLRAAWRELFPSKALEPWMFGVEVTVDGEPAPGAARMGTFTLMGRIRAARRVLLGRPPRQPMRWMG